MNRHFTARMSRRSTRLWRPIKRQAAAGCALSVRAGLVALAVLLVLGAPAAGVAQPAALAAGLVTGPATGPALHSPADAAATAEALALATEIDAHYNRLHSLSLEFTQSYDGMGLHRVERGTLLLSKGGKLHAGRMRWTYAQPAGKSFVLDGKDAYFYTPGQSEVQRVPAKQLLSSGDDLRSPLALLLGHADLAKQLGGLTLTPGPGADATLSGVPHGLEKRVSRLQVSADADGTIHRLVVEELDGARNSFAFAGEAADAPAPASAFVFTPPAGTHVVQGMPPI